MEIPISGVAKGEEIRRLWGKGKVKKRRSNSIIFVIINFE